MKILFLLTSLLALCGQADCQNSKKHSQKETTETGKTGFDDVMIILGRPAKELVSYCGSGDHFPSNPRYTRDVGIYEFFTGAVATRYKGRINAILIKVKGKIEFTQNVIADRDLMDKLGIKIHGNCKVDTVATAEEIFLYIQNCFPPENAVVNEDIKGFYYTINFKSRKSDTSLLLSSIVIQLHHKREEPDFFNH